MTNSRLAESIAVVRGDKLGDDKSVSPQKGEKIADELDSQVITIK